ncbi:hypothetical protein QQY66_00015 [Streptomyces sp. DG2A-72]|uniref:hypothetical protein n=1 Tax=Streptomyces sp. DG2A-72 TaxID=3051386 RepID=UPI00265C2ED4|nr:hypothetical protein [Streptomyces sp. DG2A-72]MDO0930185.1 hypothetical protein [Streptomyces sp. DG2A-72]
MRGCSRFAQLIGIRHEITANLLFIRFEFSTGDASGHNMATLASDALLGHLLQTVPGIAYGSISGNYCTDKKATAINGILGRGKNVVTELLGAVGGGGGRPAHDGREDRRAEHPQEPARHPARRRIRSANAHYATRCSRSTWPRARTRPTSSKARRASSWPRTAAATSISPARCPT